MRIPSGQGPLVVSLIGRIYASNPPSSSGKPNTLIQMSGPYAKDNLRYRHDGTALISTFPTIDSGGPIPLKR